MSLSGVAVKDGPLNILFIRYLYTHLCIKRGRKGRVYKYLQPYIPLKGRKGKNNMKIYIYFIPLRSFL